MATSKTPNPLRRKADDETPRCAHCGETYSLARKRAGYNLCMPCGEERARQQRHTVVPMNKSNYVLVSDPAMLKQLNPKYIAL